MRVLALAALLGFSLASAAAAACSGHVTTAQNGSAVVASTSGSSQAPMTKIRPQGQQGS